MLSQLLTQEPLVKIPNREKTDLYSVELMYISSFQEHALRYALSSIAQNRTISANSSPLMLHQLYLVYFERREDPENNLDKHVALFVKADGEEEGPLLHAVENHERITDTVLVLSFDEIHGDPRQHRSYLSERLIGTIADENVESMRNICKSMPDVIAPQASRKPDCVTWIDNVLYDLHKNRVVNFRKGFKLPTGKKPLQVCVEERRRHAGSSASSNVDAPEKKGGGSSSSNN